MLKAPFPYFGGKAKIASAVWQRIGRVDNVVEPFFGSGAFLLARPEGFSGPETVNDADGLLANFWRALQSAPDEVAAHADWPVNENDLHARHAWLVSVKDSLQARLEGDPEYYDAKMAGWWVWGMSCWIGSGFCSGQGPWHREQDAEGHWILARTAPPGNAGRGVNRQLPHLGNAGRGVNRKLPHLGDAGRGVNRKLPHLGDAGQGVNRKLPHLGNAGRYLRALADRLRGVRVCCGDWSRVCGPSVTFGHGLTAVLLDPPYADSAGRDPNLYRIDCDQVAHAVREWAIAQGQNPLLRVALCGYEGEHTMPGDWAVLGWNAGAGFGGQSEERTGNGRRERVWFSPHCAAEEQPQLFA